MIALKRTSHTLRFATEARAFTVNLLPRSSKGLITSLIKAKGDGHKGDAGPAGAPRLPEAYAGFDCKVIETHDIGGDHVLVVADVVEGWKKGEGPALTVQDAGLRYAG